MNTLVALKEIKKNMSGVCLYIHLTFNNKSYNAQYSHFPSLHISLSV